MPNNTYVALDTKTLTEATSSITFTSIPSTYTDLHIVAIGTTSISGTDVNNWRVIFNGDSTSGLYSNTIMQANGVTPISARDSNSNYMYLGAVGQASVTSQPVTKIDVMGYAGSTNKTVISRGNAANAITNFTIGTWRNTDPVTSITLYNPGYNIQAGSSVTLYGIKAASVGAKATGGTIYQDASYYYHVFSATDTFTPLQSLNTDIFMVAGGGGGGARVGGGGGAGGYRLLSSVSASATPYTITVGAGGSGQIYAGANATSGTNSSALGSSATGGGYGGMYAGSQNGATGGSGGGANGNATTTGSAGNAGSYSPVEGYAGGNSTFVPTSGAGGGGGGAAGAGVGGVSGVGGTGGAGVAVSSAWLSATGIGYNGYIAGGGGGGTESGYTAGVAGTGGGGSGSSSATAATAGRTNTGSGGGGGGCCSSNQNGGNGGSGIVIVRYAK